MTKRFKFSIVCSLITLFSLGQSKHFDITVGDFTTLNVIDGINVVYESNAQRAGTAVFDCPQLIADGLIFTNNMHGRLNIQLQTEMIGTHDLPTLHVYSRTLAVAENASDSTLSIHKPLCNKNLKVILSNNGSISARDIEVKELELMLITGKGRITANGFSHKLKTQLLGKGTIDATDVSAQYIQCQMAGTGNIEVTAEGSELNIRGTGTGRINYVGTPSKLKVRKLGPLKVTQVEH